MLSAIDRDFNDPWMITVHARTCHAGCWLLDALPPLRLSAVWWLLLLCLSTTG
jgi:hypothetical protein